MQMYVFELMQKRNMKKFSPGQQKFLCTMIVDEAKKAAKEHEQDFQTAYYMMAHGLWGAYLDEKAAALRAFIADPKNC